MERNPFLSISPLGKKKKKKGLSFPGLSFLGLRS